MADVMGAASAFVFIVFLSAVVIAMLCQYRRYAALYTSRGGFNLTAIKGPGRLGAANHVRTPAYAGRPRKAQRDKDLASPWSG